MSMGRQVLREILDAIETEFFKKLETRAEWGTDHKGYPMSLSDESTEEIKVEYQRATTKALADYLEKVYIQ